MSSNMVNFGPLTAETDVRIGAPQQILTDFAFGFLAAQTSLNRGQPNFARCLAVSWAGTLYKVAKKLASFVVRLNFIKY